MPDIQGKSFTCGVDQSPCPIAEVLYQMAKPVVFIADKVLDLPAEVEDNLKQVVLYQVQSFEPTEEEKYYYDYIRLPAASAVKRLSVLLVMVRRSLLDAHLAALRDLGIKPVTVSIGSAALANLFLRSVKESDGKIFILANLTAEGVEVTALRDGAVMYSRNAERSKKAGWQDLLLQQMDMAAGR